MRQINPQVSKHEMMKRNQNLSSTSSLQVSELLKLGGDNYENMKQFSVTVEEKLFRMSAHRDRALTYKTEEVQLTAVDEVYVEQEKSGHVVKHVCRVRVFFLSFLSG